MTNAATHDHIREAKAKASARRQIDDGEIELFWLVFTNPDIDARDPAAFMGVAIVPATKDDFLEAVRVAHHFKCNPAGSQVMWLEKPNLEKLPRRLLARLLNADEVAEAEAIIAGELQ